jgi:3-oxoacyl-[acyl-carrier protein] reductase
VLEIRDAVAVITGGSGGIGQALAAYWLKRGGKVVLADIRQEALDRARYELEPLGAVSTLATDVTREEDCARLADFAVTQYGGIHLVAPFAGMVRDGFALSVDQQTGKVTRKMGLESFRSVLDVTLTGVFLTARECAERMINRGSRGLICLISSVSSLGTAGQLNYASAKAAVAAMPKVLTAEFFRRGVAQRLRCLAVAPGYVGTPMVRSMSQIALDRIVEQVPIGRLIEPEEVASFVGELYRNEALAGDVFFIHGGLRLGSRG